MKEKKGNQEMKNYILAKLLSGKGLHDSSWDSFCSFLYDCKNGNEEALEVMKIIQNDIKKEKTNDKKKNS